jgi:hypothetical protein
MKRYNLLLCCMACTNLFSQEIAEKEIKSDVNEVTVFIKGAQITRKKAIELPPGETVLAFRDLSPFIDPKSIQVKADGNAMVLSVNHQHNFLDKLEKPREIIDLEAKLEPLKANIKLEKTYLDIIAEELAFLKENRDIGSGMHEISMTTLKEASAFYSSSLKALKLKEIEHNNAIEKLNLEINDINKQIGSLAGKKEYSTSEILIKVNTKNPEKVNFEISYLVKNASWFPSYDIRAKSIKDPVELIYKANVIQDTKEDWKNVKIRFSSTDPNKTGNAPELKPYLLNYNTLPPVYNRMNSLVTGRVSTVNQEPLPGVSVQVEGTTIGTVTNAEGTYSISIPANAAYLVYSYIGYVTERLPVSDAVMNVQLTEDMVQLQEVVVTAMGIEREEDFSSVLEDKVSGVNIQRKKDMKIRGAASMAVPSAMVENQTTVDFEIKTPYTVLSDNKNYAVDMEVYELPAEYQYYCAPKVDKDAFLIANIVDWEKYNLLEGEANIFFEDTFVGKSLLDVRYAADTLNISLGRDKNVSVNREKVKDFTTRQFIGNKKEESRDWLITVKNNKNQKINMFIVDQIPVSTLEEIEVDVQKLSGANHNKETGEVNWKFTLDPNEKKEFDLRYAVKYPKYHNLLIE